MRSRPLVAALLWAAAAHAQPSAGGHLLAGARLFRDARFDEALVEFRVAEKLGAGGDAAWYAGACLVKLGRAEEAVETFARAAEQAPAERDALLDYYRALGCYGAKLYLCADRLLSGVQAQAGPRVAEMARKVRGDIARMLATEPPAGSIDWYLARGDAASTGRRPALARAYFEEAAALAERRADRHGLDAARSALARVAMKGTP